MTGSVRPGGPSGARGAGQSEHRRVPPLLRRSEAQFADVGPAALPRRPEAELGELHGDTRSAFVRGARRGITDGFGAAMLLIAVSAAVGAVAWIWLLRPAGGRRGRGG